MKPTLVTWILVAFGLITCGPLLYAQLIMILRPHAQQTRDFLIGKGEQWRDNTHFKSAYALAWVDWICFLPMWIAGIIGVLLSQLWGYALFGAAGAMMLYINIFLWFFEREVVYPAFGPLAYYTYVWGNFIDWGATSLAYVLLRLIDVTF
jgi:hypothetical protein